MHLGEIYTGRAASIRYPKANSDLDLDQLIGSAILQNGDFMAFIF
jgi:hypothetical protein